MEKVFDIDDVLRFLLTEKSRQVGKRENSFVACESPDDEIEVRLFTPVKRFFSTEADWALLSLGFEELKSEQRWIQSSVNRRRPSRPGRWIFSRATPLASRSLGDIIPSSELFSGSLQNLGTALWTLRCCDYSSNK